MIYNYYKRHNNYSKIKDYLTDPLIPLVENISIKKKIKKLNEANFFTLFEEFIYYKSILHLTKKELEFFFIENRRLYEEDEDISFFNLNENKNIKILSETYVTFNFKSEIKDIVNYFLTTAEFPKQNLITKLYDLKERILEKNISTLIYVKDSFLRISHSNHNIEEMEKSTFICYILDLLEDYEAELYGLVDDIDNKINSFSTAKTGNYLIDLHENILRELHKSLEDDGFIDIHKTSSEQFIEVLKSDWKEHQSIIDLKMDNIQFKYFIECFEEYFNIVIQLSDIETFGNITLNSDLIKAGAVSASYSTSKRKGTKPKRKEIIKSIFETIKKIG